MKKIFTLFVAAMAAMASYAVPAYQGWQKQVQPDGTEVKVRLVGDENHHYWLNEQGEQVQCNEQGYWVAAGDEANEAMRRVGEKAKKIKAITRPMKAIGDKNFAPRGLVILVNYKDKSFNSNNKLADFKELLNSENYTYNGATGSVRKYFSDQSDRQYTPEFDVYGPVTLPNNMSYYGGNDSDGYDKKPGDMIVEACSIANALHSVDFTRYDNDGDGYVDFVYVIYAGQGEAAGGAANTIWPHAWDLESAYYYNNCKYSSSQRKFDGKTVLNYACSSELNYDGSRDGIGTIAHEFSHVIGLPDLYDIDYGQNYENESTPGSWHIMDAGSYNNDGNTPPNYTIYDKYFLGWLTPENPGDEAQVLTLAANEGYQIASSNTLLAATTTTTTYYIENRQQTGWDAHLPGHGLVIWKVTYNSSVWADNGPNDTNGTLRYTIISASGKTTGIGTAADAFPGTKNKTSWSGLSSKPLNDISESNGVITLTYISDPNEGNKGEEPGEGGDEAAGSIEGYSKITNAASLVAGDKVVLYSDEAELGITGWDGTKTATAAATGWVEYVVESADGGFLLKDGSQYIALTAKNSFSYNATGSVCKVTADGVLYITLSGNDYLLYENANNGSPLYRMYTDKTGNAQYKPFYVYKAEKGGEEPSDPTDPEEPTGDAEIKGLQYCDAYYYEYEGVQYYDFDLYADFTEMGDIIYPEVYLSVEAKSKTAINGTYDIVWAGYWINEEDAVEIDSNKPATITVQHVDNEGNYKMTGSFVGTNGVTYSFNNVVDVLAYDYDNDDADITLSEEGQEPSEPEDPTEPEEPTETGDVVFVPSEFETVTNTAFEIEKEGVTIACTSGSITVDQFRFFKSQDVTISTTAGVITKIEFTCTANDDAQYGPGNFVVEEGNYSYSGKVGTWTGEETSVTLKTYFAQVRATKVVVTVSNEQGGTTTGMEDVDCETGVVRKLIKDGQLLIMRDGEMWNVLGVAVGK